MENHRHRRACSTWSPSKNIRLAVMRAVVPARTLVRATVLGVLSLTVLCMCLCLRAPTASAGEWMQVSCVNPSGTASPSEGWTGAFTATGFGASTTTACGVGAPMSAVLGDTVPEPVFSAASLTYTPPPGSILIGGRLGLTLQANGAGTDADGAAVVYEPALAAGDERLQCAEGQRPCTSQGPDYSQTFTLPSALGGVLVVAAQCDGSPGYSCDTGGRGGAWAQAQVSVADLLLSNDARPRATGFTGAALDPTVHRTAHVAFDATDPGGPGVYQVAASLDGTLVQRITPNLDDGTCIPVGTDSATQALMFDVQQPCPTTAAATLAIPTARLPDGDHRLTVTVTDAAGNTATVLTRTIITGNPLLTPAPRTGVRTRFDLSWRWGVDSTTLRSVVAVRSLPADAHIQLSCTGGGCPELTAAPQPAARLSALIRSLRYRTFRTGDRLVITVTDTHRATERLRLTMRPDRAPTAAFVAAPAPAAAPAHHRRRTSPTTR
jgi:hypothetical protein